jgi:hypothetical protein
MEKRILPFDWREKLENTEYYSVDNDFILLEKPVITDVLDYPFKLDVMISILCLSKCEDRPCKVKHRHG